MASDLRRGPPFNDVDGGAEGTTMGHLTVPPPDQKEYAEIAGHAHLQSTVPPSGVSSLEEDFVMPNR